jgi:outer membrane immunogenic protein
MRILAAGFLSIIGACLPMFAQSPPPGEIALAYNYVRTNAPPGGCGCFSMNGGSVAGAYNFKKGLSLVGDLGVVHNGNVDSTNLDLTLVSYLFGPRYSLRRENRRLVPFGQVLLGGVHDSGRLSALSSGKSANAFAMTAGGGLDVVLSPHLAIRVFQAEYFLTLLPNNVNDRQNNFRLSIGVVIGLGR